MINWPEIKHFTKDEFNSPSLMDEGLIFMLDNLREEIGQPIFISSSYRPGDPRSHGKGKAVDITDDLNSDGISSQWRFLILRAALELGFCRIGVYDGHIHLDICDQSPQNVIWHGYSE